MNARRRWKTVTAGGACLGVALLGVAIGCGGAEVDRGGAYDPAALAALASPMPCPCTDACAPNPSAVPVVASEPAPMADAGAPVPEGGAGSGPSFDPSKPRHLLQGTVTGPTGKPVANAVVYLDDAPVDGTRGRSATLGQKNMQFVPFLSVIAKGGKVIFTNDDPFPHNVNAAKPERFDLGQMSAHAQRARTFDKPGVYQLLCNLHPNMLAYVYVTPGSYFAVTNGQGKYAIKDVPEGVHAVGAWAPGLVVEPATATVGGEDSTFDVALHKPAK
jgi:plastocyanin